MGSMGHVYTNGVGGGRSSRLGVVVVQHVQAERCEQENGRRVGMVGRE